jgi:hypothetical protein
MKTTIKTVAFALAAAWFSLANAGAQPSTSTNDYNRWWAPQFGGGGFRRGGRGPNQPAKRLPLISVKGNKFVDPDGRTVLFRGVAIADPDKVEHEGHWSKEHFEQVKAMGATLVRIPVHPIAWRQRGASSYLPLLDQAVAWCNELDMYVIIDWHSIGNLQTEMFQEPMYDTTQKETFGFWRSIAQHFAGRSPDAVGNTTVAFYELFNEPTTYRGQLGKMTWAEWRSLNEQMIAIIRAFDEHKIPLVGGLDWAYDLTALHEDPVRAPGVGYTVHPYSNKRTEPWPPKWEEDFGFAAADFPMMATEFGFGAPRGGTVGPNDYGNVIIKYLEGKGISWTAWCFDPQWGPTLLQANGTNYYTLNGAGEFFKSVMQPKTDAPPASAPAPAMPARGGN